MNKMTFITAIVFSVISAGALASDGKITFKGEVVKQSCVVDTADKGKSVTLPKVSSTSLEKDGSVSGTTPFTISLTGCETGSTLTDVGLSFVGANIDTEKHTLKNVLSGDTAASNVNIALYNQDDQMIKLGMAAEDQNVQYAKINGTNAQFNYFAKYFSLGSVKPGSVETNVDFEIIYK